jgi:hypothetical protein
MSKLFTLLVIPLLLIPAILALPDQSRANDPLEKITFIHYKDGSIKPIGSPAKAPTCYKLLGVKWKSLPVSYTINPDSYAESFVTSAISAGTEEWDAHTSANLFNGYTVDYSADWDDTPDKVDYINEYSFGAYPDSNVIAVTNVWYTRLGRQIVDYDVLFNTYYTWADCTQTNCSDKMDLQNIAIHETGHGIGLADIYSSTCSDQTMYGYSWYGDITKRDLAYGDITGLQKMYGA